MKSTQPSVIVLISVVLAAGLLAPARAQTFSVAVDSDNDMSTGCDIMAADAGGGMSLSGFELLLSIIVGQGGSGPEVVQSQVQTCDPGSGSFGTPTPLTTTPYPVALNQGLGGADSLESELAGTFLLAPLNQQVVRLAVTSSAASGAADALTATAGFPLVFPPALVGIPTLSEWGLILLGLLLAAGGILLLQKRGLGGSPPILTALLAALALSTLVYGATLMVDGDVSDWGNTGPLAVDPAGVSTLGDPAADIRALFVSAGSLFFRVDVQDLEQDPPVAVDDTATTDEDTPVGIDVLANDSDPDVVDVLSVLSVTAASNGSLVVNLDDTITYTPDADFNGADGFDYTIQDSTGLTDSATVTVNVTSVNDPPMAVDDTASTDEDTSVDVDVLANDSDDDGPLTVIGFSQGSNGAVADLGGGILRYTPNADFNGADSFTYEVQNGSSATDTATVDVTVDPVNDAPFFTSVPPTGATQDVLYTYNVTTADVDLGDVRSLGIILAPAWLGLVDNGDGTGTLSGTPGNADVGPNAVELVVTDFLGASSTQPYTITVNDVNDAPTADPQMVATDEDTPLLITLTGSDPEGDSLSFAIDTPPSSGTLGAITPIGPASAQVTYTPNGNFNGVDSFGFTVDDGALTSAPAVVDLTVNSINDDPVANPQSQTTPEDTPIVLTLTGSDVDGDTLTFTIVPLSGPSNGSLGAITPVDATSAMVTYTPNLNFNGADQFTFMVDDGNGGTDTAVVDLTVGSSNDNPTANPQMVSTNEDTALPIMLTGSDVDGDALTFTIVPMSGPSNGSLGAITPVDATTAMVTYTPNLDFNGADQFTFMVDDGNGGTDTAVVDITVNPIQDSPTANPQMQTINEDTPVMLLLTGSDVDGDTLTFTIVPMSGPSNGMLGAITPVDASSATVTYTPNLNFNGSDSFDFQVDDGNGNMDTATVDITINPVNDDPVAQDDDVTTDEETALMGDVLADNGNGADSDAEGDPLTVTAVSGGGTIGTQFALPSGALLTLNANGSFTYDPNGSFESLAVGETGMDSFGYTISDGNGGSAMATVNLTIDGVNDPPTAQDDDVAADSNMVLNGDVLADNGNGADSDPDASDTLTVSEVNGSAGDVGMQVMLASGALVTVNANGTFSYDPNGAFDTLPTGMTDTDSFMYTISDGNGGTDTATVTVTITGVNGPPVAQDDDVSTDEDTAVMGDVTADNGNGPDSDPDSDPLTVTELNGSSMDIGTLTMLPSGALLTLNSNGTFSYDPNGAFESLQVGDPDAMDSFLYTLSDGTATDTATVNLSISGVDDPPAAMNDSFTGGFGNTQGISGTPAPSTPHVVLTGNNVLANDSDVDGPPLMAVMAGMIATANGGTVAMNSDGSFDYFPPVGFEGAGMSADTFSYELQDPMGGASGVTATVSVDVSGMVWYIDGDAAAGGNGTSASPFNTINDFNTSAADAAGENIFLYAATSPYTQGINLLDMQTLLGEPAGFASVVGLPALPMGTRPVITNGSGNGINLAAGNTINEVDLGDTSGVGLTGMSVGTLTVSNMAIGDSGAMGGSGAAVNINTGTLSVTFDSITSDSVMADGIFVANATGASTFAVNGATSISAAGGDGIDLSANPTSTFTFTGTVNIAATTGGVGLRASTSGTVNMANASNSISSTGGAAVDIDGTTTGMTFASLTSTNSSARGVDLTNLGASSSFNGGTTTVTNAAAGILTANGAINVNTVAAGSDIDFGTTSVNSRNGTGIFLDNVAGGSTVDFGATTIPNPNGVGGYGIRIEDSAGVFTFASANISSTAVATAGTYDAMRGLPSNDGDGDGVFLKNNTGSVTFNGGTVEDMADNAFDIRNSDNTTINGVTIQDGSDGNAFSTVNSAIQWHGGTNLTLSNSTIDDVGNDINAAALVSDNGMKIADVDGDLLIQNTTFDTATGYVLANAAPGSASRAVEIDNRISGNLDVTVTGSSFLRYDFQGLNLRHIGGSLDAIIGGPNMADANTFQNINGAAVNTGPAQQSATGNVHGLRVENNTFTTVGIGVEVFSARGNSIGGAEGTHVFILNNTINGTISDAIRLAAFAADAGAPVIGSNNPIFRASVTGNTITGVGVQVPGMGGGNAFFVAAEDNADSDVTITGHSNVSGGAGGGTNFQGALTTQNQRNGDLDLVFQNNSFTNFPGAVQGFGLGFFGNDSNMSSPSTATAVRFGGNDWGGIAGGFLETLFFDAFGNAMDVEGYAGLPTDSAALHAYVSLLDANLAPHGGSMLFSGPVTGNAVSVTAPTAVPLTP